MTVTLFPFFLNYSMEQISILHSMNLFIMESVNCFGKERVQDRKCIFPALTESLENQCKTFLKTLSIFNGNRFPSFD